MTPFRSNDRGTLMIDRILPTVGRIAKASGTYDPGVHRAIVGQRVHGAPRIPGMLDLLHTPLRRLDLLRGIRDGRIRAIEVYQAWQAGELQALQITGAEAPLKPALEVWLDGIANLDTRRGYRGELRRMGALKVGLAIHELPGLLRAYRLACKAKGIFRAFNLGRSAAMSFLHETLSTRSAEYAEVVDLAPLPRTKKRALPPALSHDDLNAICAKLPPAVADCARGMAYTGMNPKEFWGEWEVLPDRVHIDGTKRDGRIRDVPFLAAITRPTVARVTFRRHLGKLERKVSPKHFRNCFARWGEDEAGIPRWRVDLYMGHGAKTMAELYPRAEVDAFLVGDGEKYRKGLGIKTKDLLRVVKAG